MHEAFREFQWNLDIDQEKCVRTIPQNESSCSKTS